MATVIRSVHPPPARRRDGRCGGHIRHHAASASP